MRRTTLAAVGAASLLTACSLGSLLGWLNVALLGIIPANGFSDPDASDYGEATLALSGEQDNGWFSPVPLDKIVIESPTGEVEVDEGEEIDGSARGSFVMLVDGSASTFDTDPYNNRVEAAKVLAESLHDCGPNWRIALMEFGRFSTSSGFDDTLVHSDFSTDTEQVVGAADELYSEGWTPLWNATHETIGALQDEYDGHWEGKDVGRGIVVLSDGADTDSRLDVEAVIDLAHELELPVHAVGFGPASDIDESSDRGAVADLQYLASATGGYYGYVSDAEELPDLANSIARAHCGGYSEVKVRFANPPDSGERVEGKIGLKGAGGATVPFAFIAP